MLQSSSSLVSPPSPRATTTVLVVLAAWLCVATAAASSGVITLERRWLVPAVLASLIGLQLLLYRRHRAWRACVDALDTRWLVGLHVIRAPIGGVFLVLMAHGLDPVFARVAGVGDLVSGVLALGLLLVRPRSTTWWYAWNALALLDIVAVVATAQRILVFSDHPQTMSILLQFPGLLLPTFLVPLIVLSHLLVFARLRLAARSRSA